MEPLTLGIGVAGLAMLVLVVRASTRSARGSEAKRLARELGLVVEGVDALAGSYLGVRVVQRTEQQGTSTRRAPWTVTRATLLEPLPPGLRVRDQKALDEIAHTVGMGDLELGSSLDAVLWIRAADRGSARALLTEPRVVEALSAIVGEPGFRLTLEGDTLTVSVRGDHLTQARARLEEAVRLVRALAAAARAPWVRAARAHNLRVDEDATNLSGAIDGVTVHVTLRPGGTRVEAELRRPLPPDTVVVRRTSVGGERLGDVVLDPMISAVTSDVAALRQRLARDDVRGTLLEVLCSFPGSQVDSTHVYLVGPWRLHDRLEVAIPLVVELANALSSDAAVDVAGETGVNDGDNPTPAAAPAEVLPRK